MTIPASALDKIYGATESFHARLASGRRTAIRLAQRLRYRALADPTRVLHLKLADIQYKVPGREIYGKYFPGVVLPSFGERRLISRREVLEESPKRQAVRDHFLRGVPWEDTRLFKEVYAGALRAGRRVRECSTFEELVVHYERTIDPLFESVKANGLVPAESPQEMIYVHIGRRGELMYGSDGNHRWFMAEILSIETIPVGVFARHVCWQRVRECAYRGRRRFESCGYAHLVDHPDLDDLLGGGGGMVGAG